MKNEYLIKHLASVDLSFLKVGKNQTKPEPVESIILLKTISNELEKQIIDSYKSFKMPYDYTNEKDLQCLVEVFNFDYQTNIDSETYLATLKKFNIPTMKL